MSCLQEQLGVPNSVTGFTKEVILNEHFWYLLSVHVCVDIHAYFCTRVYRHACIYTYGMCLHVLQESRVCVVLGMGHPRL